MTFDSSLQRAATLVKSLKKKQADRLLKYLRPDQLQVLSDAVQELEKDDLEQARLAQRKFVADLSANRNKQKSTRKSDDHPFAFFEGMPQSTQLSLLSDEHPEVIATILAYFPADRSAELLVKFEAPLRISVLRRLCKIDQFDQESVAELAKKIQRRVERWLNVNRGNANGVEIASKLLSCTDKLNRRALLEILDGENSQLADQIRQKVWGFEQLALLSDSDIRTLLKWTDTSWWALALKSAAPKICRKIFSNMAERPRIWLQKEIAGLGIVDAATASQARSEITKSVIKLAERNQIALQHNPRRRVA